MGLINAFIDCLDKKWGEQAMQKTIDELKTSIKNKDMLIEEKERAIDLDFTQNPGKVMDDITFVRSHWWLVSEGFSLSTANSDVQKLPATLYHRIADSLAYPA